MTVDGQPIPATILGTALTLYHAGRAQIERDQGVYFYLPKMESAEEAALYRDIFDASFQSLDLPDAAVIRAIPLVESLPAVYQMEEMLYALGPYAAGTERGPLGPEGFHPRVCHGRSELGLAGPFRRGHQNDSLPGQHLPEAGGRLPQARRGAHRRHGHGPPGPGRRNQPRRRRDHQDRQGLGGGTGFPAGLGGPYIPHEDPPPTPSRTSERRAGSQHPEMGDPDNYPVSIDVPEGPVTMEGTRRNARMIIEYLEGWLNGRGAKGIDSLAGRPGIHPPLMEDLATGRISVAQVAQRIIHQTVAQDTEEVHDLPVVRRILLNEMGDILDQAKRSLSPDDLDAQQAFREAEVGYRKATKIALRWIKNYTEFNFRSLGSYTRADLEAIAAAPDAF